MIGSRFGRSRCAVAQFDGELGQLFLKTFNLAFERGGVQGGWAGLYTVTPDWSPVIDRVEQIPGLFLALGFSGSGFKMGPVVGEILADMATGQELCPIDPSIYSLERFKEGQDLSSKYGYNILG